MSKVLIVEPKKLLQYAIASCLARDHELTLTAELPDRAVGSSHDIAVIDGAAFHPDDPHPARAVSDWQTPVIWLQRPGAPSVPAGDRFVVLETPIVRSALLGALERALSRPQSGKAEPETELGPLESKAGTPGSVIELFEVIEEGEQTSEGDAGEETTN